MIIKAVKENNLSVFLEDYIEAGFSLMDKNKAAVIAEFVIRGLFFRFSIICAYSLGG